MGKIVEDLGLDDELETRSNYDQNNCSFFQCHRPTMIRCANCEKHFCNQHIKKENHNCKGKPIKKSFWDRFRHKQQNMNVIDGSESK